MKKHLSSQSGFSLVETLVAITILLLVIVGPMTISSSTAKSTSFASEQVQAFFLAQEGAEIVQKVRDDYLLLQFEDATTNPDQWDVVMDDSPGGFLRDCFESDGCGLDISNDSSLNNLLDCGPDDCRLYYDPDPVVRAHYTHTSGGAGTVSTPFTRTIYLDKINADEVHVRSVVTWRTGSLREIQSVEVETYLFDVYGS